FFWTGSANDAYDAGAFPGGGPVMAGGYACFLFSGFLLFIAVVNFLSRRRNPGMTKHWVGPLALGIIAAIWGSFGGFYAIYMFTEPIRTIRSLDPKKIVAVEVEPSRNPTVYRSLLPDTVRVTDQERIAAIAEALKSGTPWAPNHPH